MRFFYRSIPIYIFAVGSLWATVWVAYNPERTVEGTRTFIAELKGVEDIARVSMKQLDSLTWQEFSSEFVSYYVAAKRKPSLALERITAQVEHLKTYSEDFRLARNPTLKNDKQIKDLN